jgi:urease accessory protein
MPWCGRRGFNQWGAIMNRIIITSVALILMSASTAFAHHPMGGMTPVNALQGFLSGIGHPLIGLDHFAFIVAVGLFAAFQPRRMLLPFGFVVATMIGALMTVGSFALPAVEVTIALSVVAAGLFLMWGRNIAGLPVSTLVPVIGLFHGWAYGGAVIGAETTPILAYLAGFGVVQFLIMLAVVAVVGGIWKAVSMNQTQSRLAGAMIAGVGLVFLVEHVEALLFPVLS